MPLGSISAGRWGMGETGASSFSSQICRVDRASSMGARRHVMCAINPLAKLSQVESCLPHSPLYPEGGCDLHHSLLLRGGSDCT